MLNDKKILVTIILFLFVTLSLSAQKRWENYEPEEIFQEAKLLFDNHNYSSAAELFQNYLDMTEGQNTQKTVEAKFYEAACSSYMGAGEQQLMLFSKENPTSTYAVKADFMYANMLFKNRKYRDALKKYEAIDAECLTSDEKAEYYFKKGLAYYQTSAIDKAEPLFYKAAFLESPYKDDARYYYAHIQYVNKKYDDAKFNFKKIENSPKYADIVPVYLMQIDYINGNYSVVTTDADEILNNADKSRKVDLALIIAESWYEQQDYAQALKYYNIARENTRKAFPREVEFQIGYCKMKQADYVGAVANFQNATKKINNDELAQYASYYLAQCYLNTKEEKFARNAYLAAYKADYDHEMSEDALFNYARLSFISGVDPFNEAVAQLDDFEKKNPNSPRVEEARLMVIHLYLNNKEYSKAIRALERYPEMNDEMQAIYARLTYDIGIQDYNATDYDGAIEYLTKTVNNKMSPSALKADAMYWLADSYFQKKDNANAEKYYAAFLKLDGAGQSDLLPITYYNLGYIAYSKGNFPNAIKNFNYFINMTNGDKEFESDAWMRVGDCYFMDRSYQKAITAYSNAVKLDKTNADYALFQQGMGYGAMGDMNKKVACMDELTKKYATSSFYDRALYEMGMAHLSTNDARSAIAAFRKLVNDRPRSAYARQGLMKIGMLYYNDNQYDNALASLKQVIKNYPNTEESREALNIIRSIYMEQNKTSEFYEFANSNGIQTSVTEQDSVSFATAENFFQQNKYQDALDAAERYINQFPNGAYLLRINY
jgi:TolA-binding protein